MIWQVRLLGWLHIAVGGLGLLAGGLLCADLALSPDHEAAEALAYVGSFFGFLMIPLLLPALIGGIGLLRGEAGGRIIILILSVLYLLLFPIGTMLGVFSLWTLLSPEGRSYFRRDETPHHQSRTSLIAWYRRSSINNPVMGLLLAMGLVAAGFVLVLALGFRLSGTPAPDPVDRAVPAAFLILTLAAIAGGFAMNGRWRQTRQRKAIAAQGVPAWRVHRDKRIAELDTDPAKRKYIPLVEGGQDWTDEQIAYNEDPEMTVTCLHLRAIERDLRRTTIPLRRVGQISVSAKCRIDLAAIERNYHLAPPAYYVEDYQGDRSAHDYPVAYFNCRDCHASISVVHPEEVRVGTPVFPLAT